MGNQEPTNTKKINKSKTSDQYCATGSQRVTRSATKKKALANEVPKPTSDFQSENPSFRIVIRPCYFYKKTVLVIPQCFVKKYLKDNGDAALKFLDGTTWFVNYCSKTCSGTTKTRIEHFDWNKFVQDNHLKVGDFCLFELIDNVKTTFRVTKSLEIDKLVISGNSKESIKKKSRRNKRKPSFPDRFEAEISSACLRKCCVHVPSSFMKSLKQEPKYLRLKVNNICWDVKLLIPPECCRGLLSAGWSVFSRDNSLKLGDVCTFQLISDTDETPLVGVSIMRKSDICLATNGVDRDICSSSRKRKEQLPVSSSQPHKKMKNKNNEENFAKNTGKAKKKPYENPTFEITMHRSYVHGSWSRLDIPNAFSRKYIKKDEGHAVLNVLGGKTWTVEYCRKLKYGGIRTALLHPDWMKFVQGNDLQIGHTCIFKLIDPDKTIFEVIILKRRKASNLGKSKPSSSNPPEAARNLTSVNPSFQAVMTSRHIFKGGGVNVPRPFAENLEYVTQVAQLQVDNRIWLRKLLIYPDYDQSLISGWVSFARENSLKVGDVCSFELIDAKNVVIKVSINRQ